MATTKTPIVDKNGTLTSRHKRTEPKATTLRIPSAVHLSVTPEQSPQPHRSRQLEDELIDKYKTLRLTLNGDEDTNEVSIGYIAVPLANRGDGIGSRALQDIVDEADRNNWTLTVTPAQEPQAKKLLLVWYGRYGFEVNPEWHEGDSGEEMTRYPSQSSSMS